MSVEYGSDDPISEPEHDRFDRRPFAKRVAQLIQSRTQASCLTIGIFGKWGEGKASVLNLIRLVDPQELMDAIAANSSVDCDPPREFRHTHGEFSPYYAVNSLLGI